MRLSLELTRTPAGQIHGRAQAAGSGRPLCFAGTLELLRVLEDLLDTEPPNPPKPLNPAGPPTTDPLGGTS